MRAPLLLLSLIPLLLGSTCKVTTASVQVCNGIGSAGGCSPHVRTGPSSPVAPAPAGDPAPKAATTDDAAEPRKVAAAVAVDDDRFVVPRGFVRDASPRSIARAIPEPSAAIVFALGTLVVALRTRGSRRAA